MVYFAKREKTKTQKSLTNEGEEEIREHRTTPIQEMQKKRGARMKGDKGERRLELQECLLPPPQPYPWLLYFSGEGRKNQTFCSVSDPTKTYSTCISALGGASRLSTVHHGWCLGTNFVSKNVSQLFLWNPYTLKKIELPPLKHNDSISDFVLSSSPTSNDQACSIFLFSLHATPIFYYCQLGDEQWTEAGFFKDNVMALSMKGRGLVKEQGIFLTDLVYCNGCFYAMMWECCECTLVVIEKLQPNDLKINSKHVLMPTLIPASFQYSISQLLVSDNELFRIEILHAQGKVIAVAVYRFDCSQRVWEKVESIKDRVFFISSLDSAFACQAINPETEGGRIYIALEENNFVNIYNIEDNSLVISQPFSNLPEKRYYSIWFMPDMRMTDTLKEEIGNSHQIREKESICGVIHSKEMEDKTLNESTLLLDVVEVIAKHLIDVLDYLHFRATNRLFRLAAPPVQWRSSSSMSMSRFDDLSLSPLFVFSEKDKVFTFVHPKHGLKYKYIINLPEIIVDGKSWNLKLDVEICCSKDGWLLLVAVNTCFSFFFNPFTKEVLPIAFGRTIMNTRCVGFSHSPTSSECVIIELDKCEQFSYMTACINFLWEDIWDRFTFEDSKFPLHNINPVFHNGLFYYLSVKGKLAVIEATGGKASWKEFEEPQAPCSGYFNSFLVECDGDLLSVFEGSFGKWVHVFKLNESAMIWIKVESLENHMLFVGNTSFSAVANITGMENKIYFPRFYGQSIVFYSLETNNYHTFENEVVNFHHMREHLNSSWIEPRWH